MATDSPLDKLVTLVLNRYDTLTRGPYKVDDALQEARQANEDSTERILLDRSELAWRAYHAASKAIKSDHGFSGKTDLKNRLNDLRSQPVERQRAFAERLASEMEINRGCKRRRTTEHSVSSMLCTTTSLEETQFVDPAPSEQVLENVFPLRDVYVGAPLEPAEELFHEQFWDSIQRIPSKDEPGTWVADISMLFQQGHIREHFGCQMEIGIAAEKVADLAFEYFGVKVETKDGVRLVLYPGGGKIEPDPSVKLRACQQDLSGIFQGTLYEGVHTSPIYRREKKERRRRTDGVSMTIPNQAKEGGRLTVFLGEWKASTIKTRIYG